MDERDIEQLARRLGERAAARVDPGRTSASVLARLRAAAIVLAAGAAVFAYRSLRNAGPPPAVAVSAPAPMQALSVTELEEVLDSLATEGPVHTVAVGLADLDEQELQELLRLMEG